LPDSLKVLHEQWVLFGRNPEAANLGIAGMTEVLQFQPGDYGKGQSHVGREGCATILSAPHVPWTRYSRLAPRQGEADTPWAM
jgi:hypothetical protein